MDQKQKLNIDISDAQGVTCLECGSENFDMKYQIRKISALLSPTGQDVIIPIQVFACSKCGIVPEDFLPPVNG